MQFTLILEDESGNQINLTTTANQYMTSEIDGLYPPAGTVSTSAYAGMNGSYLNNTFIEKRNLVISFAMRGIKIEQNRHALYKIVKPSRYVKVYYRTKNIDVYTEGYVESCASGFLVGVETARRLKGQAPIDFPQETAIGALGLYVSNESVTQFQPMNINFGIMPPLDHRVKGKRNKNAQLSQRSLAIIEQLKQEVLNYEDHH